MLTYLIILLDDTSVSYCHYDVKRQERKLISLDDLKAGVLFAMKENLNIQFVYPNYVLPEEYKDVIESIDHTKIGPISCGEDLDLIVVDSFDFVPYNEKTYLWRGNLDELISEQEKIANILLKVSRLNVVLTDILKWKEKEFVSYKGFLDYMALQIAEYYHMGNSVQLNILTDRLTIDKMNNCSAGDKSITLAPDGNFYICPAFYPDKNVGSLKNGLVIPNKHLYRLDHAPICRKCDAYQCRRCIWMNLRSTLDCNTPSHEQCVVSHLERKATCLLLRLAGEKGVTIENAYGIEEIDYLDPFNILNKWN